MLIMRFTVLMVLFVLVVNIVFARPMLESLMFAVALAVGLTPELLPMIVTVTLARSAMQMAKRKVIVKRLSAIHDLGAMNVLCTDKTGTLTEATIKLMRVIDGHGAESARAYSYAYINSQFESGMKSPLDEAILAAHPFDMTGWKKIDEVPFDFERRRVSVLVEHDRKAPTDRQGRAGGSATAVEASIRTRMGERSRSMRRHAPSSRPPSTGSARRDSAPWALPAAWSMPATRPRRSPMKAIWFSLVSRFSSIRQKPAAGATIRAMADAGITVKVLTGDNELVSRHVFPRSACRSWAC